MVERAPELIEIPAESVPVIDEADVVVIGGGTAGFIAATAAARTGARTILVERFGYLGGCLTTTYNTGPGWFGDSDGYQIIGGIPWEYVERMQQEGECFLVGRNAYSPQIWPPTTKKVALDMITEAGVELYFYMWVSDVLKKDGIIQGIVVQSKGGRGIIRGKTFVDASGDGDVAAYAGAPFEMAPTDELQQVSMDLTACGVDAARVIAWARENQDKLDRVTGLQFEHKEAGPQPMFTFVVPNANTHDEGGVTNHVGVYPTVKLCVYRDAVRLQGNSDINPLDPKALTSAEVHGLYEALDHLKYLRENIPGCEHAYPVAQNHLGVRETRRIIGDYMLTLDDLNNQVRFDDVVALNCRALDYHLHGTVFKISFLTGHHDVPLRSLLPQGVHNLIVGGRCVSSDHLAHASMRGAATCMATGHAAGTAAALAALDSGRIRDLPIARIQDTLRAQGAILDTLDQERAAREQSAQAVPA